MIISYKVRLEPNKLQLELFNNFSGSMRFIYNWALDREKESYEKDNKFKSAYDLKKELTEYKKQFGWMGEISRATLNQAIFDVVDSFKTFFKNKKGYPRYKSRKSKKSFYSRNDQIKVTSTHIQLEKIGKVKLSEKGRIPQGTKYSNPRIVFDGLSWYISVGVEVSEQQNNKGNPIGVDLGVKELAVCSDGSRYENINKSTKVKALEKRKKKMQKKVNKKYILNRKGVSYKKTNNIKKLENKLLKISRKITNIRTDFIHKMTTKIVRAKPSKLVIEDLNVSGMLKNRKLSRAIQEQCFREVRRQLEYKCELNSIKLVLASRWYPSSKTCSHCGYIKPKLSLSEREYICEYCGITLDRDLNASINLSRYVA